MQDIKRLIEERVEETIRAYEDRDNISTKWGKALIGYADAADDLFAMWMQAEKLSHPKQLYRPGKTVIAFFLPFEPDVHESSRDGDTISQRWAAAYKESFLLGALVNDAIIAVLDDFGRETSLTKTPGDRDPQTFHSPWSHLHAAYAAGLGTFGVHRGLITEKGCAGRFGSVITDCELEPTPRPEEEYCLYKKDKSCGLCVKSCPVGALTFESIDKKACHAMELKNAELFDSADVCEKCMCGKPCSAGIPVK